MNLKRLPFAIVVTLGILLIPCVWFSIASNYDPDALAGTYTFHGRGETFTFRLRADMTFHEEVDRNGQRQVADGTWRRSGEGGAVFSKDLVRPTGAQAKPNPDTGEIYGTFDKTLTVFPTFYIEGDPPGTLYRKRLFR